MSPPVPNQTAGEPAPEQPLDRWVLLLTRLAMVAAALWTALRIPLPLLDEWLPLKEVAFVTVAILVAGKLLFDTLFFDRYWP